MTVEAIFRQRCADPESDIAGHLEFMYDTVVDADAQVVVEFGVRAGHSTSALLAGVLRTGGHLWSVDVVEPTVPDEFRESPSWTLIVGNDLAMAKRLPDKIDVLFIDTAHTLRHTRAELRLYGGRAKTILLHDTDLTGEPYQYRCPPYPVRVAAENYVRIARRSIEYRSGWYGMGVIR